MQLEDTPAADPRTCSKRGILLADDAAAVRIGLGEALQRAGFAV
jgi:hypothetical protein